MISCPACAHENPDVQKFCGECGARLPGTTAAGVSDIRAPAYTPPHLTREVLGSRFALEGERKLVTVMFCDIANSTPLAARVGAEAMHGVLNRFFELALTEVHRYEGTINQFLGDGFMALFGAPIAHEDHARRALLAAGAIHQHMRDAAREGGPLRDVRVRMGLNTGMVVVGKIGDNLRMDYTAIGDTTNLAARLQGFAEPGTIRASDSTRRTAAAHFEFKDLGKHSLKGVAAPVPIFEPLGPRSAGEAITGAARTRLARSWLAGRGSLPRCPDRWSTSERVAAACSSSTASPAPASHASWPRRSAARATGCSGSKAAASRSGAASATGHSSTSLREPSASPKETVRSRL
jgi:class 3 adenylate cyclase